MNIKWAQYVMAYDTIAITITITTTITTTIYTAD